MNVYMWASLGHKFNLVITFSKKKNHLIFNAALSY